jgi:hypothetical protein
VWHGQPPVLNPSLVAEWGWVVERVVLVLVLGWAVVLVLVVG